MKKTFCALALCAALCFCAAGCSSGSNSENWNNGDSGSQNQQKYYGRQLDGNNYDDFLFVTYTYQTEPTRGMEKYFVDVTYFVTVRSLDPSYTFEAFTAYTNGTMYTNELCLVFYGKKCTLDSRGNGFLSVTRECVSTSTSIGAPKVQAAVGWVSWRG